MKFGVSQVARLFEVDRNLVKTWAYEFSGYLGPEANPPKGTPRTFSAEDLRVLGYVYMYWEDEPDYESIKIGLNTNSHLDEPYNGLLVENIPIFQELPEELDENWRHGTVFGGLTLGDFFALAESYKLAGDVLVGAAISSEEVYNIICPVVYTYRHATELYLKATVTTYKQDHDLPRLFQELKKLLRIEFNSIPPPWFENIIKAFADFDPKSTAFRYGDLSGDECWIDLIHLKTQMGWLAESFQKIKYSRRSN